MNPSDYLNNKLRTCTQYQSTPHDKETLENSPLEEYIYKKLTWKKYRKWRIEPPTQERAKEAIKINLKNNQPLKFTFPFGGYKLWRLPSAPEVDWAEFFNIAYFCQYLSPILTTYKPGAELYFSSDDIIIERMDNIPKKDTKAYFVSFTKLLESFRQYFPDNLKMEIRRIADLYPDKKVFEEELEIRITETKQEYKNMTIEKRQTMLKSSKLNVKWDGAQDLTKLSETEKQQKIEMGPIIHDAYCGLSQRRKFVRGEDRILIFATAVRLAIPIGTTKNSIAKSWTGVGVLEKKGKTYADRILSPNQWKKAQNQDHEVVKTNIIPLKNFTTISIFPKLFDF